MVQRKKSFSLLSQTYLFAEIAEKKEAFLKANPDVHLIHLGIGDTTEPIPVNIADSMASAAKDLSTHKGYSGYGPGFGLPKLRESIASNFYHDLVHSDEVFISDGAKCDLGRIQELFGSEVSIAVQDPTYPVYVDGSLLQGVEDIVYLPCTPENKFFPDLDKAPRTDLIYICSPNNPTGSVATREQLIDLVAFAEANRSVILFDTAYGSFIRDPSLPKSIFEVPGARQVAIETNSFSKMAGFTGVRLGWSVIPRELTYDDGTPILDDWKRVMSTIFNGASSIAQQGGVAVLSPEGQSAIHHLVDHYKENATMLKKALEEKGVEVYGGEHAPYLWVRVPGHRSWDLFQHLLEKAHLLTIPGVGFGPAGEGFVRFSAFASREDIQRAVERIEVFNF